MYQIGGKRKGNDKILDHPLFGFACLSHVSSDIIRVLLISGTSHKSFLK
ncbi:MAG: hypothetical protein BAJATHORv1_60041 [Candidatus Thorarchaeota archaeon]|nr:MAG: hypothetical protein BAJATHORv1_60041 [Candidatus Thorarchaeota archaeon]